MSDPNHTMKVLGKHRFETVDPLGEARILQHTMIKLRRVGLVPKGLYRFKTHEGAHKWMIEKMAISHVRLKSKT